MWQERRDLMPNDFDVARLRARAERKRSYVRTMCIMVLKFVFVNVLLECENEQGVSFVYDFRSSVSWRHVYIDYKTIKTTKLRKLRQNSISLHLWKLLRWPKNRSKRWFSLHFKSLKIRVWTSKKFDVSNAFRMIQNEIMAVKRVPQT